MTQKKMRLKVVLTIAALILLLVAIVYQKIGTQQDTLNLLQNVSSKTASYENMGGKYPAYKLYDQNKDLLGYGVLSKASGYGGPITVLIGINQDGQILNVKLIEDYETPYYLQRVVNNGYLEGFVDKTLSSTLKVGKDLDAISGATVTAEGIATAVRKATNLIGSQEFALTEQNYNQIDFGLAEVILLLLFAIILFSKWKKTSKLRTTMLVISVFFLGFKLNAAINLGNFASLISGNAPSFLERPFWFILIIGTILLVLITGRNYYCSWLCPFGAVQEGINKSLGLVSISIPKIYTKNAKKIRLILTWVALMTAFIFVNPSIASYEPFSAFFSGQANSGQWLLMGLALIMSIFINRFWCRFFCPTGAVLDLISSTKRTVKSRFLVQKIKSGCLDCKTHTYLQKKETEAVEVSGGEDNKKFIFFVLIVFIFLIIFTLIKNSGVF